MFIVLDASANDRVEARVNDEQAGSCFNGYFIERVIDSPRDSLSSIENMHVWLSATQLGLQWNILYALATSKSHESIYTSLLIFHVTVLIHSSLLSSLHIILFHHSARPASVRFHYYLIQIDSCEETNQP